MMKRLAFLAVMAAPMVSAALDNPDTEFYVQAAQLGLAEVDLGLLAKQHGKSPNVADFGAMMVKDHGAMNARLQQIAAANNVDLPAAATAEQVSKKQELAALSGDDFDRSYIEAQILAHKKAIALFKTERESGDSKDALQFAEDTLPTLQMHLTQLFTMPMIPPATAAQ